MHLFTYPSILLLMSFYLTAMTGYFRSRLMFDEIPLVFAGLVIMLPFIAHSAIASFLSYYLYVYFFIVYEEDKRLVPLFVLLIIYFVSWISSDIVFGGAEISEDEESLT